MNQKIWLSSEFVIETCANCGLVFAMLKSHRDKRLKDHKSFFCPNGHGQHYIGKSEEEKLKDELAICRVRHDSEQEKRKATERSRNALRGVITKMKRKV